MDYKIRKGRKEDLPSTLALIRELAEYEKALEQVSTTIEQLEIDGFGEQPLFELFVAEFQNQVVGISLYYYRYSTWKGKTLYLEDIIVNKDVRGKGIGQALFDQTIQKAKEENCFRMSWQVLDWNNPAINFYKKYGATIDGEWLNCDFFKDDLERL